MHQMFELLGGEQMSFQEIQNHLQQSINNALDKPCVVTGWVASVQVLIGDEQKVVSVQPSEQAPALTTGIITHAKILNKALTEGHTTAYDTEEE